MRHVGSYFEMTPSMYQPPPAGTPGWAIAPVPGWGTNPLRAGPRVLAMNGAPHVEISSVLPAWAPVSGLGDAESDANEGYIALAAAGGIFLGWFLCWAYHQSKKKKKA